MSDIVRSKSNSKKKRRALPLSKRLAHRFPRLASAFDSLRKKLKQNRYFAILFSLVAISLVLSVFFITSPLFAHDYTQSVGHFLRVAFATVFSILPVSVGEILFLLFLLAIPAWIVLLIIALKRKYRLHHIRRYMRRVLPIPFVALLLTFCLFLLNFFSAYRAPDISYAMGLNDHEIYENDLYDTLAYFVDEINHDLKSIEVDANGSTVNPLTFRETATLINDAYQEAANYQSGVFPASGTPAKQLLTSKLLTRFGLAGVFTFYTGEANVNTASPDFVIPQTIAHECAHQRGIATESDAEFIAFVACTKSDNAYIRYSAHLTTLLTMKSELDDYLATCENEAYKNELAQKIKAILAKLDPKVQKELDAYSAFYQSHHNETLSGATEDLIDSHLKAQGDSRGVGSYQNLTGLIVNFYITYLA